MRREKRFGRSGFRVWRFRRKIIYRFGPFGFLGLVVGLVSGFLRCGPPYEISMVLFGLEFERDF